MPISDILIKSNHGSASVEEQAVDLCYILNESGMNFYDGGTITNKDLSKTFGYDLNSNCFFETQPESPIDYAIDNGWLINLYDSFLSKQSLMLPIKVGGPSTKHLTVNSLFETGIPPKVLGCDVINSKRLSPRARIEKLLGYANDSDLNLSELKTELNQCSAVEQELYGMIITLDNTAVTKLKDEGFSIKSNAVKRVEKLIGLKTAADTLFKDYAETSLESILELNPSDFSGELYSCKPDAYCTGLGSLDLLKCGQPFTEDDIDLVMNAWDDTGYNAFRQKLLDPKNI